MANSGSSRPESVYLSYLPENEAQPQSGTVVSGGISGGGGGQSKVAAALQASRRPGPPISGNSTPSPTNSPPKAQRYIPPSGPLPLRPSNHHQQSGPLPLPGTGMRPLQLRPDLQQGRPNHPHSPGQQQQQSHHQQQRQQHQIPPSLTANGRPRPQVPTLQVTVPQPSHQTPTSTQHGQLRGQPRSPYNNNNYPHTHPPSPLSSSSSSSHEPASPNNVPASPRAVFAQRPPHSPSTFSLSTETLVGSPGGGKGGNNNKEGGYDWSPKSSHGNGQSSPSIRNFQLSMKTSNEDLVADPENDRLMPATPGLAGSDNFWKRFSTVIHEKERKEAELQEEKLNGGKKGGSGGVDNKNGKSGGGKKKDGGSGGIRSSWLEKTNNRQKNYRICVGLVAFLIIAAIAGGVGYHYATKSAAASTETDPTTHDFGLGDDESSSSIPSNTGTSITQDDESSTETMPSPSLLAPGVTLQAREWEGIEGVLLLPTMVPMLVPVPVVTGHGSGKKRTYDYEHGSNHHYYS